MWEDDHYNHCVYQLDKFIYETNPRKPKFEVGDIVRMVRGTKPIKITEVINNRVYGKYLHSGSGKDGYDRDFVKLTASELEQFNLEEENMSNENTLYEFELEGSTLYGNKIAVNSQGKWVMEVKGTNGSIVTVDPNEVTEVTPYTIQVEWGNGAIGNYIYEADKVSVGDIIMASSRERPFGLCVVKKVDTKNKVAHDNFKIKGRVKLEDV